MSGKTKVCPSCELEQPEEEFKHGKYHCYTCQKRMSREWKAKNRGKVSEYNHKYKKENKETIKEYNAQYHMENRDAMREKTRLYHNKRAKEDFTFKLAQNLRRRFTRLAKGYHDESALDVVGCSLEFFQLWMMYRFYGDMDFHNHGKLWHLDHVVPVSKFDLTDKEEMRKCFHWSNFQPLTAKENISKNCYATVEEIMEHEEHLAAFLEILPEEANGHYTLIEIDRYSYIS